MPSLVPALVRNQADKAARERLTTVLIRAGQADAFAFEELYRLTARKLLGVSLRICGDRTAAEDVLQDVYLRVWHQASLFDPSRGSAFSWLSTITRNRSIDWLRIRASQVSGPFDDGAHVPDNLPLALDCMIASSDKLILAKCLSKLDDRQREAIKAAFYGGITYADIAHNQGVPLGTVKSWIRRGLIRLKVEIEVYAIQ